MIQRERAPVLRTEDMIDAAFIELEGVDHRPRPKEAGGIQAVADEIVIGRRCQPQVLPHDARGVGDHPIGIAAENTDGL